MYKNIWTILAPNEAIPFRIIKPFHSSLHLSSPPDGDLEDPRGRLNRDSGSRRVHKLRGVYQNEALSQESNRLLRYENSKILRLQNRFKRKKGRCFQRRDPATASEYRVCTFLFHIVKHLFRGLKRLRNDSENLGRGAHSCDLEIRNAPGISDNTESLLRIWRPESCSSGSFVRLRRA